MHRRNCLPLLAALLLVACDSPRTEAIARLSKANVPALRTDAARLHTQFLQSPDVEYLPLKSNLWPDNLRKLKPLRIGLYRDGLEIALREEPGFEFGLHIVPMGVVKPPNPSPYIQYERLDDGIYWYTLQR